MNKMYDSQTTQTEHSLELLVQTCNQFLNSTDQVKVLLLLEELGWWEEFFLYAKLIKFDLSEFVFTNR
jgi:hypothetical protein